MVTYLPINYYSLETRVQDTNIRFFSYLADRFRTWGGRDARRVVCTNFVINSSRTISYTVSFYFMNYTNKAVPNSGGNLVGWITNIYSMAQVSRGKEESHLTVTYFSTEDQQVG